MLLARLASEPAEAPGVADVRRDGERGRVAPADKLRVDEEPAAAAGQVDQGAAVAVACFGVPRPRHRGARRQEALREGGRATAEALDAAVHLGGVAPDEPGAAEPGEVNGVPVDDPGDAVGVTAARP